MTEDQFAVVSQLLRTDKRLRGPVREVLVLGRAVEDVVASGEWLNAVGKPLSAVSLYNAVARYKPWHQALSQAYGPSK